MRSSSEQLPDFHRINMADLHWGIGSLKQRSAGAVVQVLVVDEHNNAVVSHGRKKSNPAMP